MEKYFTGVTRNYINIWIPYLNITGDTSFDVLYGTHVSIPYVCTKKRTDLDDSSPPRFFHSVWLSLVKRLWIRPVNIEIPCYFLEAYISLISQERWPIIFFFGSVLHFVFGLFYNRYLWQHQFIENFMLYSD